MVVVQNKNQAAYFTYMAHQFSSLSHVWLFATPWTTARQASLSITNSRSPPKPTSIVSVMPSNHLILLRPLLLLPKNLKKKKYSSVSVLSASDEKILSENLQSF